MKQLDLIYSPKITDTYIFNNLDLNAVTEPLYIEREEPHPEDEPVYEKKKSEVVEYEDEEYISLLEQEQEPYIVTDSESKSLCGKFQNMPENSGMYFAFINTGRSLKVVPISKWYRFVQRNRIIDSVDVEGLEKNINGGEHEMNQSESEHEIDYEQSFDDDEEEDANNVMFEKEKKLSNSGKKLQGLVTHLEEHIDPTENESEDPQKEVVEEQKPKKIKQNNKLTKENIIGIFGGKKIGVKELLRQLSAGFKLDDTDKNFIRSFVKESCEAFVDKVTGETMLKLKK